MVGEARYTFFSKGLIFALYMIGSFQYLCPLLHSHNLAALNDGDIIDNGVIHVNGQDI